MCFLEERIMENQIENPAADNRRIIPYAKGKKTVTFYDTFVDMNGDVVKYDDIAVIQAAAQNTSSMIYFYFSKSFNYNFTFTTYDGTKHALKRSGYSAYGIGTYKRIKEEFETIADPMYTIVVRSVGERLINRIENGATANICGLQISRDQIVYEKRKKTIVIDKSNFDRCVVDNSPYSNQVNIYVRDEKKPVFRASLNEDNARLITPIVNYFFSYQPEQ